MGQQNSKGGVSSQSPASPIANHSPSLSATTNSRKESRAPPASHKTQAQIQTHTQIPTQTRGYNVSTAAATAEKPVVIASPEYQPQPQPQPQSQSQSQSQAQSHSQSHSHPAHSSPSQARRTEITRPDTDMGNTESTQHSIEHRKKERRTTGAKSTPVRVPRGSDPRRQRGPDSQFEPSGPPRDPNYIPHSNLNFPPRLPLPIQEEVHAPGSPVIAPQGFSSSLNDEDVHGPIPRQSSAISNTTIDDDALGDELQPYPYEAPPRGLVPTLLEWKQGGDRVYVTGTFTGWSRKYRMNRDPNTGYLATLLPLPPGTHHVKFIIDGEMQLSNELPTAVDYTNILVNYVEVSADDIPREPPEEPRIPEGVYPPLVLNQGTEAKDHAPDSVGKTQLVEGEPKVDPVYWGKNVPKYLHDVDLPEHSKRYIRAARGVTEFSTPPGLPLFLGKSILNGTTPMKDDSSVLNMPNHTVLNHLATSSIKHEVLATSITTRYKRKYVTTIVYKPTESSD